MTETVDLERRLELLRREEIWPAKDGAPLAVLRKYPLGEARSSPVVLIHGLRGCQWSWNSSIRSFQAALVAEGYPTLCPELRGSGSSRDAGSPPPKGILELLELDVVPLIEEVCEEFGEKVVLIGHSMGGILSCLAAASVPGLVEKIVGIASPLTIGVDQPLMRLGTRLWVALSSKEPFRPWAESESVGRALLTARRLKDRLRLPPYVRSTWPGSMEPALQAEFDEHNSAEPGFPALLRDLSRLSMDLSPEGMDIMAELERVEAPFLCVAGDRDELVPMVAARALFEAVGGGEKEWLLAGEEGSHLGHADIILGRHAPRLVWTPIIEWLQRR